MQKLRDLYKLFKKELLSIIVILIVSFALTADLLFHQGNNLTYDGRIHTATMAQFWQAISEGELPVRWSNNFANFGLPLPIFAHQIPAYLGAIFIGLGFSAVTAYSLVMLLAVLLGNIFLYWYLRKYFRLELSLLGIIFYSFFAYKILNIYTRGALPEVFASSFVPLILLGIDYLFELRYAIGLGLFVLGLSSLALTHPMLLFIFLCLISVYVVFKFSQSRQKKALIYILLGVGLALLISAYYLLPLMMELRYLYQGTAKNIIDSSNFLGLENFIENGWYYFYSHPGPRGHFLTFGKIEISALVFGFLVALHNWRKLSKGNSKNLKTLSFWLLSSLGAIVLTLPISAKLYTLPGFRDLQFPWRFINILQISVVLVFLFALKMTPWLNKNKFLLGFIAIILVLRVPELYGKNYTIIDDSYFNFTKTNLHSQSLNTVWSDNSENYPTKTKQAEIIDGNGEVKITKLKNSSREYALSGQNKLRVLDNTFYFPGWKVWVDGTETPIEFQDPNFRGLITYEVPAGEHQVLLKYTNTKIRMIGQLMTATGVVGFLAVEVFLRRTSKIQKN